MVPINNPAPVARRPHENLVAAIAFLAVLYIFFLSIGLMSGSMKLFGKEEAQALLASAHNPIIGLIIGVLATSLVQSSSTTTTLTVIMVANGTLTVGQAVPIVMGANIGTTITNTIVSMGQIGEREAFGRAFSGAVVHDFFNLCAVLLFLPLEIMFHPIQRGAEALTGAMFGFSGATLTSPIAVITKPVIKEIQTFGGQFIESKVILGSVLLVVALVMLIISLSQMVKIMKGALAPTLQRVVDKFLFGNPFKGLGLGVMLTVAVQSSSVTTSMVVPLIGTGMVTLEAAFPFMLGANIGTTITALLAAFASGVPEAVTIAFCHLLFNLMGTAVFLPLKALPITLARKFGALCAQHRWAGPVYVGVVFFAIPAALVSVF
ncbi:MAG: Na/Pi symporter [Bradymonadia bacterium]